MHPRVRAPPTWPLDECTCSFRRRWDLRRARERERMRCSVGHTSMRWNTTQCDATHHRITHPSRHKTGSGNSGTCCWARNRRVVLFSKTRCAPWPPPKLRRGEGEVTSTAAKTGYFLCVAHQRWKKRCFFTWMATVFDRQRSIRGKPRPHVLSESTCASAKTSTRITKVAVAMDDVCAHPTLETQTRGERRATRWPR